MSDIPPGVDGVVRYRPPKAKTHPDLAAHGLDPKPRRAAWVVLARPHVLLRLRRVFTASIGRGAPGKPSTVEFSDTPEGCLDLRWVMQRFRFEVAPEDRQRIDEVADREVARQETFARVLASQVTTRDIPTAEPLRDYQRVAVELAHASRGLLIADQLGLGKTITAIGLLAQAECRPAVVVVPLFLALQWERAIRRFLPGARPHVIRKGTPYDVLSRGTSKPWRAPTALERSAFPDVFILPYTRLDRWAATLAELVQTVVFDEAHELRGGALPESLVPRKYHAAVELAAGATWRIGLSATPVNNYGNEAWALLDVLRPGALGTRHEFQREWCRDDVVVADPAALGSYLRSAGLAIRRTREEVGRELPPLSICVVDLELPDKVEKDVRSTELARAILDQSRPGASRWVAAGELDMRLRQWTGIAKAPQVAAFVAMIVAQGEQVVLAGWHREVYDTWAEAFVAQHIRFRFYTGTESTLEKDAAVREFVAGRVDVLVLSLRAGAGLDGLQDSACSTVVFGELDWSPQVHAQVLGRLHRDGQVKPITGYHLVATSGSDPIVVDVLGVKRQQAVGIEDPEGAELAPVRDTARGSRLALAYLEAIGEAYTAPAEPTEATP